MAQRDFEEFATNFVVAKEDTVRRFVHYANSILIFRPKEVPCRVHIGSIRHQGSAKYGNVAISGVIAAACDHAVVGSFVDMANGEAYVGWPSHDSCSHSLNSFALGTLAQRNLLTHTNSPPHPPTSMTPMVRSYDSECSFTINDVPRAIQMFPDELWLHDMLKTAGGQIPANHINTHRPRCQNI